MQSKGLIRLFAILLAIASIWQLSFTAVTRIQEKKAAKVAAEKAQQFVEANNVAADVREFVLDSVANIRNRAYIDSISNEKVYLGYTYQGAKEKEINLGLDLKGGMNVMLQVQLQDLVKALAGNPDDPDFVKALDAAKKNNVNSSQDFIGLFETAWAENANGRRLAEIFGTYELRDKVKPESTDKEVIEVIRTEAKSAIDNSFNVLRNRIDRFGVTQPNIQRIENSGKILIELPGVKDPERVRKLLQGTASLEFWTTFENSEILPYLEEANETLAQLASSETVAAEKAAASDDVVEQELAQQKGSNAELEAYKKANPLFAVLTPSQSRQGALIGYANAVDTARVNALLKETADIFPAEFRPMWSVKPTEHVAVDNVYELVAIKVSSRDGKAPLDGSVVTDARVSYNNQRGTGAPTVSMSMNAEGANIWAR
ncbi:MAG: protein translocase subunit SecDF, partial [Bacteroidales bacterium]|nr:protein translocase subunit SecDF [Bacteroidales bacterium]